LITGTPSTVGTSNFTAKATDRANVSVTKQFTIKITSDLTITTPLPLSDGVVGAAYAVTLAAAGGKPPYGWSIKAGALPTGLALSSSTGTISGAPTTANDFHFTVQVADNLGATFTKDFSIHVALSALPNLTISGLPSTMDASDQSALILTLDAPYSADIHGQITLAFQPDATVNVDDPAIQFAGGGRTATFTIAANSLQPTAHIALQTGTVSGTITVTITYQSIGGAAAPVVLTRTVHIARAVPSIRDNGVSVVVTSGGFEMHITGWSTPRNLTDAKVHLTPAAGHNLQTTDLTVSLASVAPQWYASAASAQFGSQFTLVLPFTVQGTTAAIASVSVQLTNSVGASLLTSASF
jgi:hypothetical protein